MLPLPCRCSLDHTMLPYYVALPFFILPFHDAALRPMAPAWER